MKNNCVGTMMQINFIGLRGKKVIALILSPKNKPGKFLFTDSVQRTYFCTICLIYILFVLFVRIFISSALAAMKFIANIIQYEWYRGRKIVDSSFLFGFNITFDGDLRLLSHVW